MVFDSLLSVKFYLFLLLMILLAMMFYFLLALIALLATKFDINFSYLY